MNLPLNKAQREAVAYRGGPLLVLAGAGTGKTRVLVHRVAALVEEAGVPAYRMMCVTFTNKAAREMSERIAGLIPGRADGLWLGTFHGLAVRILRRHADVATETLGIDGSFLIIDSDDQYRLLRRIMIGHEVDPREVKPGKVMDFIQGWKDRSLEPDRVPESERDALNGLAITLYRRYQQELLQLNACDFGDLLVMVIKLFAHHPEVLATYQERFRHILVDEYQDTNLIQNLMLSLLAHQHHQLCCVGDDDQSIYGWRGAEIRNILEFSRRYPEAKVVRLEENYRSVQSILDAADGVIGHNKGRLGKTLHATLGAGDRVGLAGFRDSRDEARGIAGEIVKRNLAGEAYRGHAILIRAGHVSQTLESALVQLQVPYRVYGGQRFYEREEIRDAVAYLRLIHNPDDDLAFERIINKPTRGVGQTTQDRVRDQAGEWGVSRMEAVRRMIDEDSLGGRSSQAADFVVLLDGWRQALEVHEAQEVLDRVLKESGIDAFWRGSSKLEAEGKLENLGELRSAVAEFESLAAFLEHVALVMDDDRVDRSDVVSIMTIHAAKGLEFDHVFLPAWEEGIFPNPRSVEEGEDSSGLEEERRLAYVAMTRARKRLEISFACERMMYGQVSPAGPSRFLREIPDDCLAHSLESVMTRLGIRPRMAAPGRGFVPGTGQAGISSGFTPEPDRADTAASRVGQICSHPRFGQGTIVKVEGRSYDVAFDGHGTKKIMQNFVTFTEDGADHG